MTTTILAHMPARPARVSDSLYDIGYRCRLVEGSLMVKNPAGVEYMVTGERCSCPATRTCKHIRGAATLAVHQANSLCWQACRIEVEIDRLGRDGNRLTVKGMELRRRAVAMCDRAAGLRQWSEGRL